MKLSILLLGFVLAYMERFVIRRTRMNKWFPLVCALIIATPIALLLGPHLVVWPVLMIFLSLVFCEAEDWWNKEKRKKHLTELEKMKIKDL